ncbi:hypothetical protein BHE74_00017721 [Ensete ventricosum]|uniref:Uncharacterized protein n=1 Tax=Ensete ventricosum TaxID=4639 RepID=A0A444FIU8_ENSVE|nr:hypothetical protein GW17_00013250 [Ensete ventricosum]RWW74340.1 hypothetical protein BHE74_00017721 [Ensete ventricosum]RZR70917.1 hypothetical protein BHM03_00002326 [Ensete ventricosum]
MDERIPPAVYFQYSPCGVHSSSSPHHSHEVSSHLRRRKVCIPQSVESMDYIMKQQLRELAISNGPLRDESPHMSPSTSPFNSTGTKPAKTGNGLQVSSK